MRDTFVELVQISDSHIGFNKAANPDPLLTLNLALDNLQLVTRAELMKRNSYHQYGPEISKIIQLRGALALQINKRERNAA